MAVITREKQKRMERLMERGYALLQAGQFDDAMKVGRELIEIRHTSGFEVLARAYRGKNQIKRAIRTIERGTEKVPHVWVLWKLLGDFYSDDERYKEAQDCYDVALLCPNTDAQLISLNRGIAFVREGRMKEAEASLRSVREGRLVRYAWAHLVDALLEKGDKKKAIEWAVELANVTSFEGEQYDAEALSIILGNCAEGLRWAEQELPRARKLAVEAVQLDGRNSRALETLRNIVGESSKSALCFRVVVSGVWHAPIGRAKKLSGFYRTADVAAEDKESAFLYLQEVFPEEVRASLKVEEARALDVRVESEGVCWLSGYMFFPRRGEKTG